MSQARISALDAEVKSRLAYAKQLVDTVKAEKRELHDFERKELDRALEQVEALNAEKQSARESGKMADEVRSKIGGTSSGWNTVAKGFARGDRKVEVPMAALWETKALTESVTNLGIVRRDGIAPLTEDVRRMFLALRQNNVAPGTLHIEHYEVASHSVASGTVMRNPTDTTTKAEISAQITYESLDLKQFAATISTIPAQLLESQPKLSQTLQSIIGVEIEKSLDLHVFTTLDDSGAAVFSGGSTVIEKLARGVSDLRKAGANADLAFISDTDAETIGNLTEANVPQAYPFNLSIVAASALQVGELIVLDSSGVLFHRQNAAFLLDPYSGLATNTVRVRLELNALCEVVEPLKIRKSASSLVT